MYICQSDGSIKPLRTVIFWLPFRVQDINQEHKTQYMPAQTTQFVIPVLQTQESSPTCNRHPSPMHQNIHI